MVHRPPGQFYHGIEYEVSDLRPGEVPEKPDATMFVKGQELNVTRYAEWVWKSYGFQELFALEILPFVSTEAGRETSGMMWRMEKMCPAGSFIIMGQESLMEMQAIILCLVFLKPLKSQITHKCNPVWTKWWLDHC